MEEDQPPFRDLLGHLCAEIERQQAQLRDQGEEIAELAQDNRRLRLELEAARPSSSVPHDAVVRTEAAAGGRGLQQASGAASRLLQDAECQTVPEETSGIWEFGTVKLVSCACDDASGELCEFAPPAAADSNKLQQPEPAPEPPQLTAAPTRQQESFSAAGSGSGLAMVDGSSGASTTAAERSSSNACPTNLPSSMLAAADEDGPPWSLSPTSLASNSSSPMWLGSASESFSSESSPPAADDRRKAASMESVGDQPTNWPGLRRHPPEAALVSAAGNLAPQRLVRSILDALDTAQRRLQQSTARQKAKRAAAAAAAAAGTAAPRSSSQVQVDIRIYLPSAMPDDTLAEDRARVKDANEVNTGSFMYILL